MLGWSLLAPAGAECCDIRLFLEDPTGARREIFPGETQTILVRTLYNLCVAIPITECFVLSCDVRIAGQPWDNDRLVALQPMNKWVWKEDYETYADHALVAAGIFRAPETGSFEVVVTYGDESMDSPRVYRLPFVAK